MSILGPEWNLSPDGITIVTENGAIKDTKTALKKALDSDLKIIGKAALSSELAKHQVGKIVLQIQKIRNISAPKAKEESQAAPRMLKLTLTDGESYVQAIEMASINSISRERTAPGTKVLINGAQVNSGYLLINPQNFSVLGGQVEHLHEKWLLAKSIQQNHQYVSTDGAPQWVPFGSKINAGNQEHPFGKSLDKNKEGNANSEFDQQRKDAIAEASTGAVRKVFGGRVKLNVQPVQSNNQYNRAGRQNDRGDNERGRKGKFGTKEDESIEKLQKPSDKVSLFSFLEDKLPAAEVKKPVAPSSSCNKNNCNNYHQRDPRIQQKTNGRQQIDKTTANNSKDKQYNQSSFNSTSASKPPSKSEDYKSSSSNFRTPLTQKSSGEAPAPSASDDRTNSSYRSTANSSGDSTNYRNNQQKFSKDFNASKESYIQQQNQGQNYKISNDRNTQGGVPNHYRNDRYPQQPVNGYPTGNYAQPPNQYRNDRYSHQNQPNIPPYPADNSGYHRNSNQNYNQYRQQQYPNANSYAQANNQYNHRPQYNYQPQQSSADNAEMHQLANNLSKMSVSNEFASRSLRQHLNLGPPKKHEVPQEPTASGSLNVGDQCLAKYWEDGKFYPAIVSAITDKTYAIQFKGYGNIEEVLKHDCFSNQQNRNPNYNNYEQNNFSGSSLEFRSKRGPPRN